MPQLVLDPANTAKTAAIWKPQDPIPPKVRAFGYFIDLSCLKPGDLILVSSVKPGLIARAIRRVQLKGGYNDIDARWEHAAVHIGSGAICEATRSGVEVNQLFDYIGSHLIRVRRNTSFTHDEGWNLAVTALRQKNYRYGFMSIIGLYVKSRIGFWNQQGKPVSYPKRSVYCSELYADAHVKVCNIALGNLLSGEVTPASLSLNSKSLSDVAVSWLKIHT